MSKSNVVGNAHPRLDHAELQSARDRVRLKRRAAAMLRIRRRRPRVFRAD